MAQQRHRIRRSAANEEQAQRLHCLEKTLSDVVSVFLGLTDDIIQSDWAHYDVSLIHHVREGTERVLSYVADVSRHNDCLPKAGQSTDKSSNDAGSSHSLGEVASPIFLPGEPSGTLLADQLAILGPREVLIESPISSPSSQPAAVLHLESSDQRPEIDKSDHIRLSAMATTNLKYRPRLDNPLSLRITYLAIQNAFLVLSASNRVSGQLVSQIFGSALEHHTREEILGRLSWCLGPGYGELALLATASFQQLRDGRVLGTGGLKNMVCSADDIARLLRQRVLGDSSRESWQIVVTNNFSALGNNAATDRITLQNTSPSLESTRPVSVLVSKARLLQNISRSGICLGSGPVFSHEGFEQAILDSLADLSA